ncbi:MAG: hypothetical protein IJ733_00530 [Lachnospiraceae bacterium]|nr:hypothetical protein [Lachnospiraceae bacterium]
MINDCISQFPDSQRKKIFIFFPDIRLIKAEKRYYLSGMTDEAKKISDGIELKWEDPLWQK